MNTLARYPGAASRILGVPFETDILGVDSLFDRLLSRIEIPNRLMNSYKDEDGARRLEFNLAGFKEDEISVRFDTALHELLIGAERNANGREDKFSTSVSIDPYTSPEDLSVAYEAGILSIVIPPFEKRLEESLVQIPLSKSLEANTSQSGATEEKSLNQ